MTRSLIQRPFIITALLFFIIINLSISLVYSGTIPKGGIIAARGLVLGSNNKPIWVEYDASGNIVEEIGEAHGEPLEKAFVMSAEVYRSYVATFQAIEDEHSQHREIVSASQYQTLSIVDINNNPVPKPQLQNNTYSVVIRTKETLYGSSVNPVLHESPLNLINGPEELDGGTRTILLSDEQRQILAQSENNISLKSAYFTSTDSPDSSRGQRGMWGYQRGDKVWGPIAGAEMSMAGGTKSVSNANGHFVVYYMAPPNCFEYSLTPNILAKIRLQTFNPQSRNTGYWYMVRDVVILAGGDAFACPPTGLLMFPALLSWGGGAPTNSTMLTNFAVDLAMLSGQAMIENVQRPLIQMNPGILGPIPMGSDTVHAYVKPLFSPQTPNDLNIPYDFDGDGKADQMRVNPQGGVDVWLGDADPDKDEPDFTRLTDYHPDFFDRGLVQSVSKNDLEDTDIYVYRLANDQRIAVREGLRPSESNPYHGGGASNDGLVNYRMLMVGPAAFRFQNRAESWRRYQTSIQQDEELHGLVKDHLKTGDKVRIIMVNRATGYIGSVIAEMGTGNDVLSFNPRRIIMRPPNITISAERRYNIEKGLTQGDEKEYLIGFEGSGLTSDEIITVTTEFYDWDGTPFPDDFPGFTGRLAKVVQENVLGQVSGELANFEIKPGRNTQLIQLPQDTVSKAHYYIHVSADPPEKNPNFEDIGAGMGGLQYRPKYYVPIKVNVFDEEASVALRNDYKKKIKNLQPGEPEPEEPEAVYASVYRPEMQFSLFDLDVKEIKRKESETNEVDIIDEVIPAISPTDLSVDFIYSLLEDTLPALEAFGPGRELILAIGSKELKATVGENKELKFDDLEHLAMLDPLDYLSIRLYQNSDDGNVLWEYAYALVDITPPEIAGEIEVSADDNDVIVSALILDGNTSDDSQVYTINWEVEGSGTLSGTTEANRTGSFSTDLNLSTVAGDTAQVTASLDDSNGRFRTAIFKVIPGKPSSIEIESTGEIVIGGLGEKNYTITVRDQYNNLVEDGTPVYIDVPDVHVETEEATVDGVIHAKITALETPGVKEMVVSSGEVKVTEDVNVHDVTFTWAIPSVIRVQQNVTATVTASSSYGDLTGLEVRVSVFRGNLGDKILTIDQSGQASTTYYTGPFRGDAQLYARVGNSAMYHEFYVDDLNNNLQLSETIIVGDESSDGQFDVVTEQGTIPVGYKASTNLIITGTPGETRDVSLGTLADPVMEPVLNYGMERIEPNGIVFDTFQGIDAESNDISIANDNPNGFGTSYQFDEISEIRVPSDSALNLANNIGIGFRFKPSNVSCNILEYDIRDLTLSIDADSKVLLEITTTDGDFSVTSEPIVLDQWHVVGAAYKDGKVILEVDGEVYESPATGDLTENPGVETSMRIGLGLKGLMSDFRVNNWSNPSLMTFGDGSTASNVTIGPDGKGIINIGSTGQMTAMSERNNLRFQRMYAAMNSDTFIRKAYAADLPAFCSEPGPENQLSIEALEYFFDYLEKCYFKQKLDNAKVRIKEADGWKERLLGIRDLATTIMLSKLAAQASSVVTMINCVDGFLTGSSGNATQMLCDFISGFLIYGDIRDFIIHSYYMHFGDSKKFDQATYTLAGLGIITNLLEIGGFFAGGAPGVVMAGADAAVSGIKLGVKVFRRAGKLSKYMKHLCSYLSKNVMEAGDMKKMADALLKMMPLIELTAVFAFYKDDFEKLIEMLMDTVQSEEGLEILSTYIYGFLEWTDNPQTALMDDDIFPLVKDAHAIKIPIRGPIHKFIKMLDDVEKFASQNGIQKAGEKLRDALRELTEANKKGNEAVRRLMYKGATIKAYMISRIVGKGTPQKLRDFMGSRIMSHEELYQEISELPTEIVRKHQKGLGKSFNLLDTAKGKKLTEADGKKYWDALNKSQGGAQEIHQVHYLVKKGRKIRALQEPRVIKNAHGQKIGERVDDLVEDVGGGNSLFRDSKAWSPDTLETNLKKSLKTTTKEVNGKNTDVIGQLYRDIVDMRVRGTNDIRWDFDHRVFEKFSDLSSFQKKVKEWIIEGVQDKNVKARLMKDLNLRTKKDWDDFIKELKDKLDDFADVIPKHGTYT